MSAAIGWQRLMKVQQRYPVAQIVVLVVLFLIGRATLVGFSSRTSVVSMLLLAAFLGIAGAGQTIVILLGGLDLSVAPVIGAANISIVWLVGVKHVNFSVALIIVLVYGASVAGLAGWLSIHFRIQPLIVSLGTGAAALGLALVVTGGATTASTPDWLSRFTSVNGRTLGVSVPPIIVVWATLAVGVGIVLHFTVMGRRIYLAGTNPIAAELAHIDVERTWLTAWMFSGICAAVVGVLFAGFSGGGDATVGNPYLFTSIAAVIIGGTSLIGATGDYWRTCLGSLILIVLTTILVGRGYNANSQELIYGAVIFLVVAAYGRDSRVRDRV